MNLYRISCKACLFTGRLSINDTDDIDDMGETSKALWRAPHDRYTDFIVYISKRKSIHLMSHFQRGFNLSPHIVLEGTVSNMIMPDFTKIRYVIYVKDLLNINRAKDFGLHSLIATTYRYQSRVSYSTI